MLKSEITYTTNRKNQIVEAVAKIDGVNYTYKFGEIFATETCETERRQIFKKMVQNRHNANRLEQEL